MNELMRTEKVSNWVERWNATASKFTRMTAQKEVCKTGRNLKEKGYKKVLDLGCGTGRHSLWFAHAGYEVCAYDSPKNSLESLKAKARAENLNIDFKQGNLEKLPYANGSFDYVLAWDTINNSDITAVQKTVTEIHRILKPGGIFQGTLISKRNISQVPENSDVLDSYIKDMANDDLQYCYNAIELVHILMDFEILKLKNKLYRPRGPFHWHFIAEKM